jgi:chemotaxis protein MotB
VLQRPGYSNWELSADRANAVRRQLEAGGLAPGRFASVEGRAATELLMPQSPTDPRNRRISITVLRAGVEPQGRDTTSGNAGPSQ